MKTTLRAAVGLFVALFLLGGTARACHVDGHVYCDTNGLPLAGVTVQTTINGAPGPSAVTDENGYYYIDLTAVYPFNSGTVIAVPNNKGTLVDPQVEQQLQEFNTIDWVIHDPVACAAAACWLTAGGAKINAITNTPLAEYTSKINFGGNVYPSCSATPGDGGQWNHLDKTANLHFQVSSITVIECGRIEAIPPSTSPATPFNYIRWQGTGRLHKPIGQKNDVGTPICVKSQSQDRNEPGSSGMRDGAGKDRYYFEVWQAGPGGTCDFDSLVSGKGIYRLATDQLPDGPFTITDGNLQLHVSSCSN